MKIWIFAAICLFILSIRLCIQAWTLKDSNRNNIKMNKLIMTISFIFGVIGFIVMMAGIIIPYKDIVVLGVTITATSIPMAAQAEVLVSSGKTISILARRIKSYAILWFVMGIGLLATSLILGLMHLKEW
jgi:hypothetical protein